MNWLNDCRMRLVLVGIVVAIVAGGGSAKADYTFGEPVNLGSAFNSSSNDFFACFSADGLEIYGDSDRSGDWDIWVVRRPTTDSDWGMLEPLGAPVNTAQVEVCASISTDGLELYFCSDRPGGHGNWDIWVTRRATKNEPWGQPVNLGATVNSSVVDAGPRISSDGLELYFSSRRPGGYGSDDIWVTRRATENEPWESPVNLGPVVNSPAGEAFPSVSPNGLLLFFYEEFGTPLHPGGFGNMDTWVTRRVSVSDPWGTPVNLGPIVNTASNDSGASISLDGSTLYFTSGRPGGFGGNFGDIYQASIIPIVDLNGDGRVDGAEFTKLVGHWGEYESLCDIGPTPLGDGIVDTQDLVVLAEYIGQDIDDPPLGPG